MKVIIIAGAIAAGLAATACTSSGNTERGAVGGALLGAAAGLIPYLGINGMGWAALVAECVWAVGLAVSAQSLTGRRGDLLAGIGLRAR